MKKNLAFIVYISIVLMGVTYSTEPIPSPKYFPQPIYNIKRSNISADKINFGKELFYDPILSKDSTISCASCHNSYLAFAHSDHALSHGIGDSIGIRNAPGLFNLAWYPTFMWDGAIQNLDFQALFPMTHEDEMGETLENVIRKLNKKEYYKKEAKLVFGQESINSTILLKGLGAFMASLVSYQSKYDSVQLGKAKFNKKEANGYTLFRKHCNNCHQEPLFTNFTFKNNAIDLDTFQLDKGRYNITKNNEDLYQFRVPTLRNLEYTSPYMHDGRFKTLSEIINHYSSIKNKHRYVSAELLDGIKLTPFEKVDLMSFLLTLSDIKFITNPKHQFPKDLLNQL